jgi:cysteine desulfurase
MRRMIALDANASVPPIAAARAAAAAAIEAHAGANPSSTHGAGRRARRLLDVAREACGVMVASSAKEVFFTSGATEGNRFVVDLIVEAARGAGRPWRVVTSPLEHPSLAKPLGRAAARGLLEVTMLPLREARADLEAAAADLADADAVIVTAAHNETGLLVPLESIVAHVRDTTLVAVDAAQSMGRTGPPPTRADLVVTSGHKLGGVWGAGALVVRGRARALSLPWVAGGQEQGVRPGTENVIGIAALGAAAAAIDNTRAAHRALAVARDRIEAAVVAAGARVIGASAPRLENTTAFIVPDVDGDALRLALDQAGVAVGFGAACSALAPEPSPSLQALGVSAADTRRVVRVSLAPGIEPQDVDEAAARIVDVMKKLTA